MKRQVVHRGASLGCREEMLVGELKKDVGRKNYYSTFVPSELQVYDTGQRKQANSGRPGT